MGIVERGVCSQKLGFGRVDAAGTSAKVEHRVAERQSPFKFPDCVAVKAATKKDFAASELRECSRRQGRIQLAPRQSQSGRLRARAFPRKTGFGIVGFGQIDEIPQ